MSLGPGDDSESPTIRNLAPAAPALADARAFPAGELIAGRYRVVRFIAQGGMGEVYEALDLDLGERVALKTVRSHSAAEPQAAERLRRELQLARKVTHPAVARVFDIGRHAGEGGRAVLFLTMELLPGETLLDLLRVRGRLSPKDALPIVEQVAAGLEAAHAAGVVHRDLKPSNVMLVRGNGAELSRVALTDFGLAGAATPAPEGGSTHSGLVMGTAAYMSPEQVEAGPITPQSDIYSLGIVMYEMVAGVRPFVGATPLSTAVKRLHEAPVTPRVHVPDLDPLWEAAILRCLARRPGERFAQAGDVARSLRGEEAPPRLAGRGPAVGLLALGLALLLGAGLLLRERSRPQPTPLASTATASGVAARRSAAVLGFRNLSQRQDTAWLSTALAEMLTTELGAGEQLRTLSGGSVAQLKADLALAETDALAQDTLARVRAHSGSDVIVSGAYTALGGESGRIRLDLRLQETAAGETLLALSEEGTERELFELVARAGARLRQRLGLLALPAATAVELRASQPGSPEAARLYAEGLAALRLYDAREARRLLERAVAAEPRRALPHAALAEAWSALGYEHKAAEEARRAFELSEGLSRQERLQVEARYRESTREWTRAVEIQRALFGFFPDDLDYGLRLAASLVAAGQAKEALETLDGLRRLPAPAGDDPRIDLGEAQAAQGDFRRAQGAAARASAKAAGRGARSLVARAQLEESYASLNLGQTERAIAASERACAAFEEAGDRGGVASATHNRGRALWQAGDLPGALEASRSALTLFREIGNDSRAAWALNSLGANQHYSGHLAEAQRSFEQAAQEWSRLGDKAGQAVGQINLARLHIERGELERARTTSEQALASSRELGNKNYTAHALYGQGELRAAFGDLPGARRSHEEAFELWKELGRTGPMAQTHMMLAGFALEAGQAGECERLVREALRGFALDRSAFYQAEAHALLARALLAEGRVPEARAALLEAQRLGEQSTHLVIRMRVRAAGAYLAAAAGNAGEEAHARLARSLDETRQAGSLLGAYEAALALGRVELASGQAAAGRARLAALSVQARARGFGLIVRQAEAALQP